MFLKRNLIIGNKRYATVYVILNIHVLFELRDDCSEGSCATRRPCLPTSGRNSLNGLCFKSFELWKSNVWVEFQKNQRTHHSSDDLKQGLFMEVLPLDGRRVARLPSVQLSLFQWAATTQVHHPKYEHTSVCMCLASWRETLISDLQNTHFTVDIH